MKDLALLSELPADIRPATTHDRRVVLHSPLLQNLPSEIQNLLLRIGATRSLRRGEHLFGEGQELAAFYYVLAGRLKEYYPAGADDQCLRRVVLPGQYISLHLMLTEAPVHTYSTQAIGAARCFTWHFDEFRDIMRREPLVALQVSRVLAEHVEQFCRHACLCRKSRALAKVAGYLLSKYRHLSLNPEDMVKGQKVQTDLRPFDLAAAEICTARETFSRALSCLQERRLIRVENGVVDILDVDGLKKISISG